jgi:hypothetical protein
MDPLANLQFTTSGALIELVDSQFSSPGIRRTRATHPTPPTPRATQKRCWFTSATTGN